MANTSYELRYLLRWSARSADLDQHSGWPVYSTHSGRRKIRQRS